MMFFPVGHVLLSVNGSPVSGRTTEDGRDVFDLIEVKVGTKDSSIRYLFPYQ